jgi:iron complex transport system ATP-binding protein
MTTAVFEARQLCFRYRGASGPVVAGVDVWVPPASLYAILGPNGSGKSTLVRLLLGALTPERGTVLYAGRPVRTWRRRTLAKQIGVVPQAEDVAFPLAVREFVAMGRYPHLGLLGRESAADQAAIDRAMERCHVADLAQRPFETLSGGERQRVRIARALAQQPSVLVLDEPTASLDIRHEMAILELLRQLVTREGVTVVVVTHNLNLAARYASRLLLMSRGHAAAEGLPTEVLSRDIVERVYCWPVAETMHPGPGHDTGAPQILPLAREHGDSAPSIQAQSTLSTQGEAER